MKRKLVDFCIISLPQHNERRDKLKNEMAKYDIECRVSHAIDGRKLLAEGNGWWFWKMTFCPRKMLNIWTK